MQLLKGTFTEQIYDKCFYIKNNAETGFGFCSVFSAFAQASQTLTDSKLHCCEGDGKVLSDVLTAHWLVSHKMQSDTVRGGRRWHFLLVSLLAA